MPHSADMLLHSLGLIWPALWHLSTVLVALLWLLFIAQVLRSPRMPAATMGWLFVIIFAPLIGIPLYLTFGVRKLESKIRIKSKIDLRDTPDAHDHPVDALLVSLGIPASSEGNRVTFHQDGRAAYQELLALLEGAQRTIDIAVFILGDDRIGREVLSHLEHKAAQGIQVRLLLDGVGSFNFPKKYLHVLTKSGGQTAWFIPVLHRPLRGRTNLRNHRKMVIADHHKIWTGGRNLAIEYLGPDCSNSSWIDLSFCQQGPAVATYQAIFDADWHFATNTLATEVITAPPLAPSGDSRIQVVPSGPDVSDDPIYAAMLTACYEATERIMIVTPYYVPDTGIQEALKLAALRGIVVDLVLPAKSNHRFADIARNRYLRELAKAGARIWLLPNIMVHAKALVVDKSFSMAGSANLDIRSLFLNCEVMSSFYTESDIEWLIHWFESLRNRSNRHSPQPVGEFKEIIEGLILLGAYQL